MRYDVCQDLRSAEEQLDRADMTMRLYDLTLPVLLGAAVSLHLTIHLCCCVHCRLNGEPLDGSTPAPDTSLSKQRPGSKERPGSRGGTGKAIGAGKAASTGTGAGAGGDKSKEQLQEAITQASEDVLAERRAKIALVQMRLKNLTIPTLQLRLRELVSCDLFSAPLMGWR